MVAWFGGEEEEHLKGVKFDRELIYPQRQQHAHTIPEKAHHWKQPVAALPSLRAKMLRFHRG